MLSKFGEERERDRNKTVALIKVTKDGKAKILEGNSLDRFLKLWDLLIDLLSLRGGKEDEKPIVWTPLKSVQIERERKKK